jgi:hypothetical protein
MKRYIPLLVLFGSLPVQAAPKPKIIVSAKVTEVGSDAEATTLTIGDEYAYTLTATDAHLAANKALTLSYTITVSSPEAASPVSVSGRLSLQATLPESEGGAAKTTQETAAAAGTHTFTGLFVVPEGLPEGDANISITLSTGKSGTVKFNKRYLLELD